MKNVLLILLVGICLVSCGRHNDAAIVNNTGQDIQLELLLNDINRDPAMYMLIDWALKSDSNSTFVKIGDCSPEYIDSLNLLKLELKKDKILELGTVRMGSTRDSISHWEFNTINVRGNSFTISASNEGINSFITKETYWLRNDRHVIILGNKKVNR